jgi:hypothetical protein
MRLPREQFVLILTHSEKISKGLWDLTLVFWSSPLVNSELTQTGKKGRILEL